MSNNLPKTLAQLNETKKLCTSPVILSDSESYGKTVKSVLHYNNHKNINFVLVEFKPAEIKPYHHTVNHKSFAENEYLGYKFAKAMEINTPDFQWLSDPENKSYNIALSFLDGENVKDYFSNKDNEKHFENIRSHIGYDYAAFAAISHADLHEEQLLIVDNKPVYFDFDDALNNSFLWRNDPKESEKKAIEFTDLYRNNTMYKHNYVINGLFNHVKDEELLEHFSDVKDTLTRNQSIFKSNHEIGILNNVFDRINGCIDHFKNPKKVKKSILQNHWSG